MKRARTRPRAHGSVSVLIVAVVLALVAAGSVSAQENTTFPGGQWFGSVFVGGQVVSTGPNGALTQTATASDLHLTFSVVEGCEIAAGGMDVTLEWSGNPLA